jgi:hypothetical protein
MAFHYPLRQRLEMKLVTGSTRSTSYTCPILDACLVFCCPSCMMCQALRAIRGKRYQESQGK